MFRKWYGDSTVPDVQLEVGEFYTGASESTEVSWGRKTDYPRPHTNTRHPLSCVRAWTVSDTNLVGRGRRELVNPYMLLGVDFVTNMLAITVTD